MSDKPILHLLDEIDVYRSAKLMIRYHGEDAAIHASMRADHFLELGDLDGQAVWKRIIAAIDELQSTDRKDEPIH